MGTCPPPPLFSGHPCRWDMPWSHWAAWGMQGSWPCLGQVGWHRWPSSFTKIYLTSQPWQRSTQGTCPPPTPWPASPGAWSANPFVLVQWGGKTSPPHQKYNMHWARGGPRAVKWSECKRGGGGDGIWCVIAGGRLGARTPGCYPSAGREAGWDRMPGFYQRGGKDNESKALIIQKTGSVFD